MYMQEGVVTKAIIESDDGSEKSSVTSGFSMILQPPGPLFEPKIFSPKQGSGGSRCFSMPPQSLFECKNKTLLIVILKLANMDDDEHSAVSVDSAAEEDVGKNKKQRATRGEIVAKRAAELAELKGVNLSLLT